MTDLEWARAFVGCRIKGTGIRFNDTVEVLVRRLAEVRQEAMEAPGFSAALQDRACRPECAPAR